MSYGTSPLRLFDESRGTNQNGVRLYNERLVLSLLRKHGAMAKADIARLTGLSAQTMTIIINRLEQDGLLLKMQPQKGKIGQPLVPFALNKHGAYAYGLKIGRRSSELILTDFLGEIISHEIIKYDYPQVSVILQFVSDKLVPQDKIVGLGIASPFELWNWEEELETPIGALQEWKNIDIRSEIEKICPFPVLFCNDATAATAAELTFTPDNPYKDYLFFYIGSFVGGGVVLNGSIYTGRTGNAGALGSMPVVMGGKVSQLISNASLHLLEKTITQHEKRVVRLSEDLSVWNKYKTHVDVWLEDASDALAQAIIAGVSVIDFEAIVLDGAFPKEIRQKLIELTQSAIEKLNTQGLSSFVLVEGKLGRNARALGGAALVLIANFGREREVLFKEELAA